MMSFSNNAGEMENVWHDVKMDSNDAPGSRSGMDGSIHVQSLHGLDSVPQEGADYEMYNPHAMELNHDNMVLFNAQQQSDMNNLIHSLGMLPPSAQAAMKPQPIPFQQAPLSLPQDYAMKNEGYSIAPPALGQQNGNMSRSDETHSNGSSPLNRSFRTIASPISSTSTAENQFYSQGGKDAQQQAQGLTLQQGQAQKSSTTASASKAKSKRPTVEDPDAELLQKDDWDLTEEELQRKKKAQNRAAQRAFRERKETKLKDLEARLLQSEEEKQKLLDQLDMIRQQNLSIQSENDVLRSRGAVSNSKFTFPESQQDFIDSMMSGSKHIINPEHSKMTIYDNPDVPGAKLLAMAAVWDYIQLKAQQHDVEYQDVDVGEIIGSLRGHERCHGYGPAYPLELVDQVVENAMVEASSF